MQRAAARAGVEVGRREVGAAHRSDVERAAQGDAGRARGRDAGFVAALLPDHAAAAADEREQRAQRQERAHVFFRLRAGSFFIFVPLTISPAFFRDRPLALTAPPRTAPKKRACAL